MPTFSLSDCSVDLTIEPLTGAHAQDERQIAWQLYLELVTRPALRSDTVPSAEIAELIDVLRRLLARWPAAYLDEARPKQLGPVLLSVIDMIFLPALRSDPLPAASWAAVRAFCQALARDLARLYRFHEIGGALPADLQAAWGGKR